MTVNYCSMTVNYHGILTLEIIGFFTMVIYHGKLLRYFYNIGPWLGFVMSIQLKMRAMKVATYSFWYQGYKTFFLCH